MLDCLNQYEMVFAFFLRTLKIDGASMNQPEVKALAKREQLKTPDFRFSWAGSDYIVDVKGSVRK